MMDVQNVKIIALFVLLFVCLVCGLLPLLCLKRRTHRQTTILNFCNCFAAGVFLGTFLLHLFPESQEEIKEAFDSDFKICEVIVAAGFFLILLIECIAIQCHGETNAQRNDERRPILSEQASNHETSYDDAEVHDHGNIFESSSTLRSLIFLLALSVHSLFEGFAVGIQETVSETLQLLLAIGIHKCVLAFSFSTNLAQQYNMSMLMKVLFLVIFSISSPIGVAIAIAISANDSNHALNGILQSLASGTFLYIIFIEIVPTLQLHKHRGTLKALVMMVGFCVMIGLQFVGEEGHHH